MRSWVQSLPSFMAYVYDTTKHLTSLCLHFGTTLLLLFSPFCILFSSLFSFFVFLSVFLFWLQVFVIDMSQKKVRIEPKTSWSLLGKPYHLSYICILVFNSTSYSVDWTLEVPSLHAFSFSSLHASSCILYCMHPHAYSIACILMHTLFLVGLHSPTFLYKYSCAPWF